MKKRAFLQALYCKNALFIWNDVFYLVRPDLYHKFLGARSRVKIVVPTPDDAKSCAHLVLLCLVAQKLRKTRQSERLRWSRSYLRRSEWVEGLTQYYTDLFTVRLCLTMESSSMQNRVHIKWGYAWWRRNFVRQGAPRNAGDGVVTYSEPSIAGATQYYGIYAHQEGCLPK